MSHSSNLPRGILWMLGAVCCFIGMAISARALLQHMGALEIVFLRTLVMLAIVLPMAARAGFPAIRTQRLRIHLLRSMLHLAGQCGWTWSLGVLTLATVFAIEFTMPVWVALISVLFLGERLTGPRIAMLVLGIAGVLIIVRPGAEAMNPAVFLMIATAIAYAAQMTCTKTLSATDSPLQVLFWMSVIQAPATLLLTLPGWVAPQTGDLPWIVSMGVSSYCAHWCLTRAFHLADASVLVPIDFIRLPLIAVIGFAFYAEPFDPMVIVGAIVIFTGTYFSLSRERRSV